MSKLLEQLNEYRKSNAYPFHMPGHKRQFGVKDQGQFADWSKAFDKKGVPLELLNGLYGLDITEIDGFDNLNAPEEGEILWQMCEKAKSLYDTKATFPLVNGSTSGLMAAISSCCHLGDEILMGRNCHKSVYRAAELLGLKTHYLYPDEIVEYGLFANLYEEHLKEELKKHPKCKCVVVTSPTYEGVILDIHQISEIVHESGAILIVDGAHGAHLPFVMEDAFLGADLVVQSLHKTLPSLTQTAVLHVMEENDSEKSISMFADGGNNPAAKKKKIDIDRVADYVHLYQSTSPSYLLMASMDQCFDVCQSWKEDGTFANYWSEMLEYRKDLQASLKHLRLLDGAAIGAKAYDIGKLVILTAGTNMTGSELVARLRENYQLECEMASANYVIAMTSVCDSSEGLQRLKDALIAIDQNIETVSVVTPTVPVHEKPKKRVLKLALATEINDREETVPGNESEIPGKINTDMNGALDGSSQTRDLKTDKENRLFRPTIEMDLRSAKEKASVWMDISRIKFQLENNVANTSSLPLDMTYHAMISGGYVMCYPPGIPILCPGEKITMEVISQIEEAISKNLTVQGMKDGAILALM